MDTRTQKFSPLSSTATWLKACLSFTIFIAVIAIVFDIQLINLLDIIRNGNTISDSDAVSADTKTQIISIFQFFVFITTSLFFLTWKNKAYKNLDALVTQNKKYSSGWAIGGYFVPILQFVRPYHVMEEIWKGSTPDFIDLPNENSENWKKANTPNLLRYWWAIFLIENFLSYFAVKMNSSFSNSLAGLHFIAMLNLTTDIINIFSCLIVFRLVNSITSNQTKKYELLINSSNKNEEAFKEYKINNPISDITDLESYKEIEDSNLSDEEKIILYGQILGLNGKISKSDITKAYKLLIEKYHPDKVSHLGKEFQQFAEKKTKDINKAYQYFKAKYKL